MAKTVTIPSNPVPYICWVNGKKYGPYANDTSVSVPDEVAALIKDKAPAIAPAAMPDTVETKIAHADTALAATVASNLAGAVSTLGGADTLLSNRIALLESMLDLTSAYGEATSGSTLGVIDNTKDWTTNEFANMKIAIDRGGDRYVRTVYSNDSTEIILNTDLVAPTSAECVIGSGEGAEGQITLSAVGEAGGAAGNLWSVKIVATDEATGNIIAAVGTNLLTFTVDSNASHEAQTIAAGNVSGYLLAAGLDDMFVVEEGFTAGNLPISSSVEHDFTGGDDGVSVTAGDAYCIDLLTYIPTP